MQKTMRKIIAVAAMTAALMLGFTGCMTADEGPTATAVATPRATERPLSNGAGAVGANPDTSPDSSANQVLNGIKQAFDWRGNVNEAAAELNRISEISRSYIVVDGDDAVVGLIFDANYRGGLTERIADMVREKLRTLDPKLDDIEITAEPDQVKRIQTLADKVTAGAAMEQLEDEFETIYDHIKNVGGST